MLGGESKHVKLTGAGLVVATGEGDPKTEVGVGLGGAPTLPGAFAVGTGVRGVVAGEVGCGVDVVGMGSVGEGVGVVRTGVGVAVVDAGLVVGVASGAVGVDGVRGVVMGK